MTAETLKQKIQSGYFEKSRRNLTWSGVPTKSLYRPEDTSGMEYELQVGDPGHYPFTRGIYEDMYRGRLWSRREITGCSTPQLTNERLRYLIGQGQSAINVIADQPTQVCLDADHPWAQGGVGRAGVPIGTMRDMWAVMDGIPLDAISTMLTIVSPIAFPSYLLLADHQGIPYSELRLSGTLRPPAIMPPVCMYGGREWFFALHQRHMKEFVDKLEFIIKNCPKVYPTNYNGYNIRETGVGAAEEVAWVFASAFEAFELLSRHGLDVDAVAPKVSFTFSVMIDIFEEVAKFRAARRVWARTLKERFGASNPASMRLKFHVNTAGILMERQQARINIARASYAALAAVLGGTQSLQVASYDEPIAIPTEDAATIALRTQQILAYETGVTRVSDPLGGSYYVESLTDRIEEEILKILKAIEDKGGMAAAVADGYIDREMERCWLTYQQEVEAKERIVVGVNEFTIPEDEEHDVAVYHHQLADDLVERYVADLRELKGTRSEAKVRKALEDLRSAVEADDPEILRLEMDCCKADCTTAEVSGVKRMAVGLSYDPMSVLEYPFG